MLKARAFIDAHTCRCGGEQIGKHATHDKMSKNYQEKGKAQ